MDKELVSQMAFQLAILQISDGRFSNLVNELGFSTAKGVVASYGDLANEALYRQAEDFISRNQFVEVSVGGYKELVPLTVSESNNKVSGYVYLITDGYAVKIGRTANVESRLAEIQTGNPRHIVVLQLIETDDTDRVEQSLHIWYRGYRLNGEWFNILPLFGLDPSDCIEALIGADSVRYEHTYSINLSTNKSTVDVAKIWIREPENDFISSGRNYVTNHELIG